MIQHLCQPAWGRLCCGSRGLWQTRTVAEPAGIWVREDIPAHALPFPLTDVVGSRSWVFEDTAICRAPTLRKNFSIFDKALRITLQRKGCIIIININSNKSLLKAIKMKGDGYRSHHSELTPSSCVN